MRGRYMNGSGFKRLGYSLLGVAALTASAVAGQASGGAATGLLRVHPRNPRYFTDGSGKAVYLTGSHTWSVFQSMGRWHSRVDYAAYLDQLQAYHHNFFRLWIADAAWSAQPGGEGFFEPQPFVRTGPGNALDGKPRFDLTKLNQAYFDELRQHVVMARDRGTYVAVMLFDTWGVGGYGHKGLWQGNPFNASNNINDLDGDPKGDGKGIEVHTLKIPAVTRIQEAYVRKVIDSVNDLDNVLYEVLNEGGDSGVLDWMKYFAKFIKDYEATKPKQHPVGITGFLEPGWDQSRANAELFLTDADWTSPYGLGPTAPYAVDPPAADGRKVVISDTDHTEVPRDSEDPLVATIWVWKSFTRGMNPIHMDAMGTLAAHMSPRERERECDQNTRRAMGNTRTMADRMDLVDMVPGGTWLPPPTVWPVRARSTWPTCRRAERRRWTCPGPREHCGSNGCIRSRAPSRPANQ
jgi:hypothetical protein